MVYSGPQVQVSVRLIETETARITAAANEAFGSSVPASVLADQLSKNLIEKLQQLYPIRGKVLKVKGEGVELNIGEMAGVKAGQRFKVLDGDMSLEVTSIQQDKSLARIVRGKGLVQEGNRVEAM
jgi:pyruvate kinase